MWQRLETLILLPAGESAFAAEVHEGSETFVAEVEYQD